MNAPVERTAFWPLVTLSLGLLVTLFFPWRQLVVVTAGHTGPVLNAHAADRAVRQAVASLVGQTLLRMCIEAAVLVAVMTLLVVLGRPLLGFGPPRRGLVPVTSALCVALTGAAAFVLPAMHDTAGLAISVASRSTLACYAAFVFSCGLCLCLASQRRRAHHHAPAVALP